MTQSRLAPLGEDDFEARSALIDQLTQAAANTPAARRLLQALQADAVFKDDKGMLVIQDGDRLLDAASSQPLAVAGTGLQELMLNNALRSRIDSALAVLQLQSRDRATRAQAMAALTENAVPGLLPALSQALDRESDEDLKSSLTDLWAMSALQTGDARLQLRAAGLLSRSSSPAAQSLLAPLARQTQNPALAQAAALALQDIRKHQRWSEIAGSLFQGLSSGSILLLAALGLAITYGLMGVINMAHGEFLMIGAYTTYVVQWLLGHYLPGLQEYAVLLALPAAFAVSALVGMAMEWAVLRQLYKRPLETLLATFGVSLLLIQTMRMLFGAQGVEVSNPAWLSGGWALTPSLVLPYNRMAIIVFALLVLALAWLVINRTRMGLFVRAVTQNRSMAACVGVPASRVDRQAFAFGAGIAGLSGVALSQAGASVVPDMGQTYIIDSFMAVVLGGVGQLAGTVTGAFGLGLLSKFIEPYWGAVLTKIAVLALVIVFIQRRPQGIFALKGRSIEA